MAELGGDQHVAVTPERMVRPGDLVGGAHDVADLADLDAHIVDVEAVLLGLGGLDQGVGGHQDTRSYFVPSTGSRCSGMFSPYSMNSSSLRGRD